MAQLWTKKKRPCCHYINDKHSLDFHPEIYVGHLLRKTNQTKPSRPIHSYPPTFKNGGHSSTKQRQGARSKLLQRWQSSSSRPCCGRTKQSLETRRRELFRGVVGCWRGGLCICGKVVCLESGEINLFFLLCFFKPDSKPKPHTRIIR